MKLKIKIDECIAVFFLIAITIGAFLQVVFRFVNAPLSWSEEIIRYSLVSLIYIATAIVVKERSMIRVEIIDLFVKGKAKQILDLIIYICSAGFVLYVAYLATHLVQNAASINQCSPSLQLPFAFLYGIESFAFFLMFLMYGWNIIQSIRQAMKGGE